MLVVAFLSLAFNFHEAISLTLDNTNHYKGSIIITSTLALGQRKGSLTLQGLYMRGYPPFESSTKCFIRLRSAVVEFDNAQRRATMGPRPAALTVSFQIYAVLWLGVPHSNNLSQGDYNKHTHLHISGARTWPSINLKSLPLRPSILCI